MKYKTVIKDGATCYAFKLRRNADLYDNSGNPISQAPKDRFILCKGSTSGSTHKNWLAVWYLETGIGTDNYYQIAYNTNAFVDLDFFTSSLMGSQFLLIGSIG